MLCLLVQPILTQRRRLQCLAAPPPGQFAYTLTLRCAAMHHHHHHHRSLSPSRHHHQNPPRHHRHTCRHRPLCGRVSPSPPAAAAAAAAVTASSSSSSSSPPCPSRIASSLAIAILPAVCYSPKLWLGLALLPRRPRLLFHGFGTSRVSTTRNQTTPTQTCRLPLHPRQYPASTASSSCG